MFNRGSHVVRLLLFGLLLHVTLVSGAQHTLRFKNLAAEDGLSSNWVRCILKDDQGFMWFGTLDGLNRFDGQQFKVYQNNPKDSTSVSWSDISVLFEDSRKNLWVGTNNGRLDLYDRDRDCFVRFNPASDLKDRTRLYRTNCMFEDRQGNLWLGADYGLNLFNPDSNTFTHYLNDPSNSTSLSADTVYALLEDRQGRFWVGTNNGLNLFDRKTGRFVRYMNDPKDPNSLSSSDIRRLAEDKSGNIWIATYGGGLVRFDADKNIFERFMHKINDPNSISIDRIQCMIQDDDGHLFIGTENGGLNQFDIENRSFMCFLPDFKDNTAIGSNSIWSLYFDDQRTLWVGTFNAGINYSNYMFQGFRHYMAMSGGLNNPNILSIMEDRKGRLWIGTDGSGINILDRESGRYTYYTHKDNDPNSISADAVLTLLEDSTGSVWIGTYLGGLDLFNPQTNRFTHFRYNPNDRRSLRDNRIYILYKDRQGDLYIGTGNGLYKWIKESNTFYCFNDYFPMAAAENGVISVLNDREGNLWIGTYSGLLRINHQNNKLVNFTAVSEPGKGLGPYWIIELVQDQYGHVWIGTFGGGLYCFDQKTETFKQFTKENGLPHNNIAGIVIDQDGNLWISTFEGLSKMVDGVHLPDAPQFINYNKGDGLQGDEFKWKAKFCSKKGEIFFGGNHGFNAFFPADIRTNPFVPPVLLTNFKISNKTVSIGVPGSPLQKAISQTKQITVSYKQSTLTFEFVALNYIQADENQYAYWMEGFDKEWNYVGRTKSATYTNLDPGSYTFHVKGSNNDQIWNQEGTSLKIIITPPFWQMWWFRISGIAILTAIILGGFLVRIKRLQAQHRQLERMVDERTAEIRQVNTELEMQKQSIESYMEALQKSNKELENFAYVASHDLQEPLRMVSSYCSLLARRYKDKLDQDAQDFIEFAVDGTKRMQGMINDLLTYSRVTTQAKPFERINMKVVMEHVMKNLSIVREEKKAQVTFDEMPEVKADGGQMERLLQNLVANGLKYQVSGNLPKVHIVVERQNTEWLFGVRDNGIGIAQENWEKVFGIFTRLHSRQEYEGSGIGLAVCKKIVERHGGRIWVVSVIDKGSTFYFTLPISMNTDS
jgi:ligand-binding sensor domain-containing protein/signal transduction histidine kinase